MRGRTHRGRSHVRPKAEGQRLWLRSLASAKSRGRHVLRIDRAARARAVGRVHPAMRSSSKRRATRELAAAAPRSLHSRRAKYPRRGCKHLGGRDEQLQQDAPHAPSAREMRAATSASYQSDAAGRLHDSGLHLTKNAKDYDFSPKHVHVTAVNSRALQTHSPAAPSPQRSYTFSFAS